MLWADPYAQRLSQLHRAAAFLPTADLAVSDMKDGVLSLIVPKPERLKPHSIEIGSKDEERQLEPAAA